MGHRIILKKSSAPVFQFEDRNSTISEEHLNSVFQISKESRNILKKPSASVVQLEDGGSTISEEHLPPVFQILRG
jgi:hypothetical protein